MSTTIDLQQGPDENPSKKQDVWLTIFQAVDYLTSIYGPLLAFSGTAPTLGLVLILVGVAARVATDMRKPGRGARSCSEWRPTDPSNLPAVNSEPMTGPSPISGYTRQGLR